jgi:type II secretory ATPase GspE/PulE/Tfp pilus assembly ATPase PilB-like protein
LNALISTHPRVVDGTAYASTLEDPPEGRPPGVSQFAVARSAISGGTGDANPFVAALRVRMRSDGDLIAVGEIRDSSTAEMFAQISMTGHKAFASLHAASSKGAYERLVSPMMGLSAETVGSEDVLALVVFQKLVPRLCPHCRIPARKAWTSEEQAMRLARLEKDFGLDCSGVYVRNHAGCPHCRAGRKGVQVVAEMFSPSEHQRTLISEGRIAKAFQDWRRSRKSGMDSPEMHGKTAFEVGLYFVSRGIVGADTLDEQVGRILQHEVVK